MSTDIQHQIGWVTCQVKDVQRGDRLFNLTITDIEHRYSAPGIPNLVVLWGEKYKISGDEEIERLCLNPERTVSVFRPDPDNEIITHLLHHLTTHVVCHDRAAAWGILAAVRDAEAGNFTCSIGDCQ